MSTLQNNSHVYLPEANKQDYPLSDFALSKQNPPKQLQLLFMYYPYINQHLLNIHHKKMNSVTTTT